MGLPECIDKFVMKLRQLGVEHRLLKILHGFHSSLLESIQDEFRSDAAEVTFHHLKMDLISNIDGSYLTDERLNANYLCQHLCQPVRIDLCLETLCKRQETTVVVEIGPPGMLTSLLDMKAKQRAVRPIRVVNTMKNRSEAMKSSEAPLFNCVAKLWELGFNIDFNRICGDYGTDSCASECEFSENLRDSTSRVIYLLREAKMTDSEENRPLRIYCIHAIGGTIYPYYPLLLILPNNCQIYGVQYNSELPSESLEELAALYAKMVKKQMYEFAVDTARFR